MQMCVYCCEEDVIKNRQYPKLEIAPGPRADVGQEPKHAGRTAQKEEGLGTKRPKRSREGRLACTSHEV